MSTAPEITQTSGEEEHGQWAQTLTESLKTLNITLTTKEDYKHGRSDNSLVKLELGYTRPQVN